MSLRPGFCVLGACALSLAAPQATALSFADVDQRAAALASKAYVPPPSVPEALTRLDYGVWSQVLFKDAHVPWPYSGNFVLLPTPPGYLYREPVALNLVEADGTRALPFRPDLYEWGPAGVPESLPPSVGFSGFRVLYPVNKPDKHDEVLVFQGTSYFRAVGAQQWYGLSARGVAIDTGTPGGEEFPGFREFWLERPAARDEYLRFRALLDGPSITGAYSFVLHPGAETRLEVKARLYLRRPVTKLGIAPLTSMFLQGEGSAQRINPLRGEEHDSDGLSIQSAAGGWIWRALQNPPRPTLYSFQVPAPRGFGLMQRDRDPEHYGAPYLYYDRRPSTWVEPGTDWGAGHVELMELSTNNENQDNIVAYWVPAQQPAPGTPLEIAYTLRWQAAPQILPAAPLGHVAQTLVGREATHRHYAVDFSNLKARPGGGAPKAVIDIGPGAELTRQAVVANPHTQGWRLEFDLTRGNSDPLQLRAYLEVDGAAATETWDYVDFDAPQ